MSRAIEDNSDRVWFVRMVYTVVGYIPHLTVSLLSRNVRDDKNDKNGNCVSKFSDFGDLLPILSN